MALKQAVREQLVISNAAEYVDKLKQKRPEFRPFTIEQMNIFLNVTKKHRLFKEGLAFSEPKTKKSRRTIPLPIEAVNVLNE